MIVELRSVPDCPNLAPVREALYAVLAQLGLPAGVVSERVGDFPSPSVLVDGVDVMGGVSEGAAACRLDLPTAANIRAALQQAMTPHTSPADPPAQMVDCCVGPGDAIRADRPQRAAGLPDGLRGIHQTILRHFATTGTAPGGADIGAAATAAGLDPAAAVGELAGQDLVAVDADGQLVAAYPFSPTPTAHVVSVGGVQVYAMCAIDALGVPFMLGADAVVTSTDPHTGQPVRVDVVGGEAAFEPAQAVVVYAASGVDGRSVDTCCSTINFFTSAGTAQQWLADHPGLAAAVLDQAQAVALGRGIFQPLLAQPGDNLGLSPTVSTT